MTIKALYPTVRPTLNLDFAKTKALDPRITFTRASTATFVGSNGLIQTAASGAARFDHNPATGESLGLLVEEARTNFITDSASANNWTVLAGGTTAASSSICPDGTTNGTRVTAVALNDGAYKAFSITTGGNHIGAYYARTRTGVAVDVKAAISGINGPTVTLPADGAWVRVAGSLSNLGAGSKYLSVRSANASMDIDVWGLQAELGSFPTSYIPTSGSTVTRAADVASMTGANFSSWYNQGQGSLLTVSKTPYDGGGPFSTWSLNDATLCLIYRNTFLFRGSNLGAIPGSNVTGLTRQIYTYTDGTSAAGACNGGTVLTGSATTPVTCTSLRVGGYSSYYLNGTIARLAYYPVRLPDAQLQALTAT